MSNVALSLTASPRRMGGPEVRASTPYASRVDPLTKNYSRLLPEADAAALGAVTGFAPEQLMVAPIEQLINICSLQLVGAEPGAVETVSQALYRLAYFQGLRGSAGQSLGVGYDNDQDVGEAPIAVEPKSRARLRNLMNNPPGMRMTGQPAIKQEDPALHVMQKALGADWDKLPPALQAHYRFGKTIDNGCMDIEYPRFMQPYLSALHLMGALIDRGGRQVSTVVEKTVVEERQYWRRTITYPDGKVVYFNSFWVSAGGNQMIEFVNPVLGLQMAVHVDDGKLHYRGVRFVAKLGRLLLPIPEWLVLGHTTITEHAIDATHFAMDFRLTHPLFGQVFRYAGTFEATSA